MAYLNLIILCSRYVFAGFALIFLIVALSFMKPFVRFNLGSIQSKNHLLYGCLLYFHLGASSILIGKTEDILLKKEIFRNSLALFLTMTLVTLFLRLIKKVHALVLFNLCFFFLDVGYILLERLDHTLATRQVLWAILAVFLALVLPFFYRILLKPKYRYIYLAVVLVMGILPFFFGITQSGATNWVQLGFLSFQPSEIGKLAFIIYLAATWELFAQKHAPRQYLIEVSGVTLFLLGCLFLQKDLGAALLYYLTFLILLLVGTERFIFPAIGLGLGALGSVMGYLMFSHVRGRVEAWLNPWADITSTGYQVVQGLFAMGTWGFWGSGLTRGVPQKIPVVTTDYIFAAVCEELGTFFGILLILCYLAYLLFIFKVALEQTTIFYSLLALGVACLIGFQTFLIIGGVLKLVPLTGITVPFMSFGGTSLVMSFQATALISFLVDKKPLSD
jgi:cell division protein FtsW (lipid II flippase)